MSDFTVGDTLHFLFTTRQFSDGVPTVLAGTPVLGAFEDAVAAPITAGVTVTVSVNSVLGLNRANIVATGANGFEAGKSYSIAITTGTVGGTSVVGEVVAFFSLGRAPALQPTTLGNTLDVNGTGEAGLDLANVSGILGNANVGWVDGSDRVDVGAWLGGAIPAQSITGVPEVDVTHQVGGLVPAPFTTGIPDVNVQEIVDTAPSLTGGDLDVNVAAMAANVLTAAAINAAALTAAKFATDAVDANALAADAAQKIRDEILPTQNAAFDNIAFLFVAASDHVTPVTGATGMAVTRSIDAGAFAAGTGTGPAEVSGAVGIYQYDASPADMNGGVITFRFTATGGTPGAPDDRFVTVVTGGGV